MATYSQDDIINAVFRVISPTGELGTCFLSHTHENHFYFLTAYHVVADSADGEPIQIQINDEQYPAKLLQYFSEHDVAILHAVDLPLIIKPLLLSSDIQQNSAFMTYGFPAGIDTNLYRGLINVPVRGKTSYEISFDSDPRLHLNGLSGAPVYNEQYEVVGIMITHNRRQLQSGTISPCKAFKNLIDYSINQKIMKCYVVLSDTERNLGEGAYGKLNTVAEEARQGIDRAIDMTFVYASDVFESDDSYAEAIKNLCRSEIALFDLTNYEPAIMFLLGVRSVVRKGITIASVGGSFSIGDVIELPFNIKEVNLVSHSEKQFEEGIRNASLDPNHLLRERIRQGIREYQSPHYSDLPTFDVIRHLPEGHRTFIDYRESLLVLCSYSRPYQERNWARHVKRDFARQRILENQDRDFNVRRILDFTSEGRLISHMMYENIRRMDLCIVDWTEWRPNVFFEMGIRLSVRESGTYLIAEDKHIELVAKILDGASDEDLKTFLGDAGDELLIKRIRTCPMQCQQLIKFFKPNLYKCKPGQKSPYEYILREHGNIQQNVASYQQQEYALGGQTFHFITNFIDLSIESSAKPVYSELIASAELYEVDERKGIPSVLYPSNARLKLQAEQATKERFLAAWYYINNHYTREEIEQTEELLEAYWDIHDKLKGNYLSADELKKVLKYTIRPRIKTTFAGIDDLLDTTKNLKQSSRAKREDKNFEGAIKDLKLAIQLLLDYGGDISHPGIKKELADCYGSTGGIYRRQGNYLEAIEMYRNGLDYEENDSYNLSNYRVLSILNEPSIFKTLRDKLSKDRIELRKQTQGDRKNQWWAWADMGMFALLNDDLDEALEAYAMFKKTGARPQDYNSTIDVLKELGEKIKLVDENIAQLIQKAIEYLEDDNNRA